jgi:hypothetical protein
MAGIARVEDAIGHGVGVVVVVDEGRIGGGAVFFLFLFVLFGIKVLLHVYLVLFVKYPPSRNKQTNNQFNLIIIRPRQSMQKKR